MGTTSTTKNAATPRRLAAALIAGSALLLATQHAEAQEILLTGPLAGATAVRKLRLYREGRFELAPAVSISLLDEYQRTILIGAKLNYNFTDWLALGVWGGYGIVQLPLALSDHIQDVNQARRCQTPQGRDTRDCRLTAVTLGPDFKDQLGQIQWVASPQITVVPFRGKLALFESVFPDSDLYFFAGPAFVGVKERGDCTQCTTPNSFKLASRTAFAPTFGIGLSFFTHEWGALAVDWRALPFSRNTGGFDTAGTGPDKDFPDTHVDSQDRQFKFNQFLTVSYSLFFPMEYGLSE